MLRIYALGWLYFDMNFIIYNHDNFEIVSPSLGKENLLSEAWQEIVFPPLGGQICCQKYDKTIFFWSLHKSMWTVRIIYL